MNTWLDKLTAESKAAQTTEQQVAFLKAHPILAVVGLLVYPLTWVLRVAWWLFLCAAFILGLKCIWIAIQWLWRLI